MTVSLSKIVIVLFLATMQVASWWVPVHGDSDHDCCTEEASNEADDYLVEGDLDCNECPEICCSNRTSRNNFNTRTTISLHLNKSAKSILASHYQNPFRSLSLFDDEGEPPKT